MLVAGDVFPDVREVIGRCDPSYVYNLMSDAIEALANKKPATGPVWQPLLIYVNLPVTQSYYVTLPSQVETVLRVNQNKNPSFPRAQLYEFTMNGPGSDENEINWSWQERGDTPLQTAIPIPTGLGITCELNNDAGVELQLLCQFTDGTEQWITYGTSSQFAASGPSNITDVLMVSKPQTVGTISLQTAAGTLLATYQPNDRSPRFQRIKLSQRGVAVRILAKRRTARVYGPTDVIPLNSKLAIVMMSKAVKYFKEDHFQEAATCEMQAIHFLEEEQASRLSYSQVSSGIDSAGTLATSMKNRDCLIPADIYDEACDIVGPIGKDQVLDKITTAIELLANKTHWDPLIGYCDICVQNVAPNYYITLPRFIDQVISLNVNCRPGDFRSKWFEFHVNGLGSSDTNRPCAGWEEVGEVCTTYTWPDPVHMVALPDSANDNNTEIRLFGLNSNWAPLTSPDGSQGLLVPCVAGSYEFPPEQPLIMTIDRVVKEETNGFISLVATDGIGLSQLIGYYWPDDTEPIYRRIKLGSQTALVRMRYRKRWLKISSLTDPIPLKSRLALLCALSAVMLSRTDPVNAEAQAQAAVRYLQDEWRVSNPREDMRIQINSMVYGGNFLSVQ